MPDAVYDANPAVYDAINADWNYDRDCQFLRDAATRAGANPESVLEIGCGTGEHTRRLAREYTVTAIDPAAGALDHARQKLADQPEARVNFEQGGLPSLPVEGTFDLVVGIRGVINHVGPDQLPAALDELARRVASDGMVVFDNSPLPADGNEPAVDDGRDRTPPYVRVACHRPRSDDRLDWTEVIFLPDNEVIRSVRPVTPFATDRLIRALNRRFRTVETHTGYGPGDDRAVFVVADPVPADERSPHSGASSA